MAEETKTLILSLDKEKFHIICIQTPHSLSDEAVLSTVEEMQKVIQDAGVQALILPFCDGKQIDIKSLSQEEFTFLKEALLKV